MVGVPAVTEARLPVVDTVPVNVGEAVGAAPKPERVATGANAPVLKVPPETVVKLDKVVTEVVTKLERAVPESAI